MYEPIEIDGREGEGGGQIVRTSAALAAITGRPLHLIRVRAKRKNPGLQAQHLTALKAVATLCEARTEGLRLGSTRVRIVPGAIRGGRFRFEVPTAGSAGLVLQAILPILLRAPEPAEVVIGGGTHVKSAPPFDHTERALLPALRAMGAEVELSLERPGYFPKGGGRLVVRTRPWSEPRTLERIEPLAAVSRRVRIWVDGLPDHVRERAERHLRRQGYEIEDPMRVEPALGAGFACTLLLEARAGSDVVTGLGERGRPAETVIDEAIHAATAHLEAGAPVGPHLADQLLVFLALGAGGRFATVAPTSHFETQVRTLARFLDASVEVREGPYPGTHRVEVRASPSGRAEWESAPA